MYNYIPNEEARVTLAKENTSQIWGDEILSGTRLQREAIACTLQEKTKEQQHKVCIFMVFFGTIYHLWYIIKPSNVSVLLLSWELHKCCSLFWVFCLKCWRIMNASLAKDISVNQFRETTLGLKHLSFLLQLHDTVIVVPHLMLKIYT